MYNNIPYQFEFITNCLFVSHSCCKETRSRELKLTINNLLTPMSQVFSVLIPAHAIDIIELLPIYCHPSMYRITNAFQFPITLLLAKSLLGGLRSVLRSIGQGDNLLLLLLNLK